jgi:DNA-binding transcriptional LysR family regulator
MVFRLPPLSALRVFEAAARHNSFQKAAGELNLTASAVSHAIQTLENWLGVALFHRSARGLRLTAAGEAYAPLVNEALSILARATERIPGRKATGTLAISSAPTFANKILLPILDKFAARFSEIRVTVDTSHRRVDLADAPEQVLQRQGESKDIAAPMIVARHRRQEKAERRARTKRHQRDQTAETDDQRRRAPRMAQRIMQSFARDGSIVKAVHGRLTKA